MISSRPLFGLHLLMHPAIDLGATPSGACQVATVKGGEFQGPRLRGTVVEGSGHEQVTQRADGILLLEASLLLRSEDGEHIRMTYRGMRHGPEPVLKRLAAGEDVDATLYYQRVMPTFETSAEKYAWLHKILAVGNGMSEPPNSRYIFDEVL